MSDWSLVYEGFEPEQQGLREALCTLGNGYFATRGAGSETETGDIHYPGTYRFQSRSLSSSGRRHQSVCALA